VRAAWRREEKGADLMTYPALPPTAIKFGTDGWRAVIGEDYTFDNVRACAASVAMYLKQHGLAERGLIVGYDARFASEDFADAVAEVVAAAGIKVAVSTVLCPTPVVSFSIIDRKAGGGVTLLQRQQQPRVLGVPERIAERRQVDLPRPASSPVARATGSSATPSATAPAADRTSSRPPSPPAPTSTATTACVSTSRPRTAPHSRSSPAPARPPPGPTASSRSMTAASPSTW
jgi:hypothetical protein